MAKFIEFTLVNGSKITVNMDFVPRFHKSLNGNVVIYKNTKDHISSDFEIDFIAQEKHEDVMKLLNK